MILAIALLLLREPAPQATPVDPVPREAAPQAPADVPGSREPTPQAEPDVIDLREVRTSCKPLHGRAYVFCREQGPGRTYAPGAAHPGPSSASGPCGMLAATRKRFGGDGPGACARYMRSRYGSWEKAERFHRANGYW